MLNRWKKRMTARGEILDIDKLARPMLPPESNGLPQLTWLAGQLSLFPMQRQPPLTKYVAPGKVVPITLLDQWPIAESKGTNITWVEVAEQLALLETPIQEILRVLANERFSANLHYHSGFNLVIMHLPRLKSAAQALSAATLHNAHQGQIDAAFATLNGMLALVQVEEGEPILISQLVRIALAHMAFATTWQALRCDGWTDAQLAQLQKAWAGFTFPLPMEKAMSMERAITAIEYERWRTSDLPISQMFDPTLTTVPATGVSLLSLDWLTDLFDDVLQALQDHAFTPVWKFAWSHHDELHYCKVMQHMIDAHREVLSQKAGALLPARIDEVEQWAFKPSLTPTPLSRMIYPALLRAFQKAWIAQTAADLAVAAIAIKRFELRHGRLPATLHELAPEFLPHCPLDPMDGKPLKYCVETNSTFRLYSVGIDGTDDAGDGTHTNRGGNPNFHYGRDLVWPQPASEAEIIRWKVLRK